MQVEIFDRSAVADDVAGKTPPAAQRIHQQATAGAAGLVKRAVVGAHDRLDAGAHEPLEGGQIGFRQILGRGPGVEAVAFGLGSAVNGKVFGAGSGLEVAGIVTLQPLHHGGAKLSGKERILAEGLLTASPARIAEDVDVGRPECESLVLAAPAGRDRGVMFGAGLVGDDAGDLPDERAIPGRSEPDDLGKNGGAAAAADAMAGLAPPIVGGHAETLDRTALVKQLADLLQQRQAADEIVDARRARKIWIKEWKFRGH